MKSNTLFAHSIDLIALIGVLFTVLALPASPVGQPTVRTRSGGVSGSTEHDVLVFKGIPFAQPPVGALRWRAPQPVKSWKGVRAAVGLPSALGFERNKSMALSCIGDKGTDSLAAEIKPGSSETPAFFDFWPTHHFSLCISLEFGQF